VFARRDHALARSFWCHDQHSCTKTWRIIAREVSVRIVEASLPDDLEQFRALMDAYLVEFDAESDPREYWDDEYFVACEAGIAGGTHIILLAVDGAVAVGL
jgi:hypothetical protein